MKPALAFVRTSAFVALSIAATFFLTPLSWAQGTGPAPYAPPPAAYPPGTYAAPPGQYPPGYYPPPGAYQPYPPPAEEAPRVDPPATATHFGVGYKIGNGLGFLGGDLIVSPLPHVVLDLQANTFSANTTSGTATGFGLAPALQFDIRDPGRSTPYVGVGYVYAKLSLDNVTASASGMFINAGYEWKWSFGMGILLGGGVCYLGKIQSTDGTTTISRDAQILPNLEFGLRFMFL